MSVLDLNVISNLKGMSKDKKFLTDLIDIFVKDLPIQLKNIDAAHKSKDAKMLKSAVHKLKSSARQLGAIKLMNICFEVEQMALANKHTDKSIPDKINIIKSESNQAAQALQAVKVQHLKS